MMRTLDGGKDFHSVSNGRPVGETNLAKRRQFVPAKELIEALAGLPRIDYEQLRADIDAVVDQDPTPRFWVD